MLPHYFHSFSTSVGWKRRAISTIGIPLRSGGIECCACGREPSLIFQLRRFSPSLALSSSANSGITGVSPLSNSAHGIASSRASCSTSMGMVSDQGNSVLARNVLSSRPKNSSSSSFRFSLSLSERERRVETLSDEIFSKGNVHLKNVERLSALPEGLHSFPEICFIGKPNAGKSSLIACLLHNAVLGRSGKKPGSTRHLKFFNVGDALALVDTPGYGGWKGRQVQNLALEKATAFSILFRYLALRNGGKGLKRVYWVMEASATSPMRFQPRDEELLHFLMAENIPFSVVLSKIDRHWRFYQEHKNPEKRRHFNQFVVSKDGTPHFPERKSAKDGGAADDPRGRRPWESRHVSSEDEQDGFPGSPLQCFQSGVRQNMEEIWTFLGCDAVPILGVSANRLQPQRSINVDALRYDLTRYAVEDIEEIERLTYKEVKALSYAPPTADDIQRVQLKYPFESFVVPQDDNLSLEDMVQRHEMAKKQLYLTHADTLTALQAESSGLIVPGGVDGDDSDGSAAARDELPPQHPVGSPLEPTRSPTGLSVSATDSVEVAKRSSAVGAPATLVSSPASTFFVSSSSIPLDQMQVSPTSSVRKDYSEEIMTIGKEPTLTSTTPSNDRPPSSLFHSTLQKTVDLVETASVSSVRAINGVMIPWTLIPPSVETFVEQGGDEIGTFASKSGAGAFEELLWHEACAEQDPTLRGAFLEHRTLEKSMNGMTSDPDEQLPLLHPGSSARQRSARRKREEATMAKYLENKRKARSVYLSAEGYMCPWLGGGGDTSAVVGATTGSNGRAGSGALMKGLKSSGFGGKSYSARTMKHRGRSTKKTGFWAT